MRQIFILCILFFHPTSIIASHDQNNNERTILQTHRVCFSIEKNHVQPDSNNKNVTETVCIKPPITRAIPISSTICVTAQPHNQNINECQNNQDIDVYQNSIAMYAIIGRIVH